VNSDAGLVDHLMVVASSKPSVTTIDVPYCDNNSLVAVAWYTDSANHQAVHGDSVSPQFVLVQF
jgi:hypothetical protein